MSDEKISTRILIVLGRVCGGMDPKSVKAFQALVKQIQKEE